MSNIVRALEDVPQRTRDHFAEASCWVLPPKALNFVLQTELTEDAVAGMHLPFDKMIVEIQHAADPVDAARNPIILFLAEDASGSAMWCHMMVGANREFTTACYDVVIPYYAVDRVSEWVRPHTSTYPGIAAFPYAANSMVMQSAADGYVLNSKAPPCMLVYPSPGNDLSVDLAAGMVEVLAHAIPTVLQLMAILRCDNAPVAVTQAPPKVNKKRAKKGRILIPAYRTLHITDHTTRSSEGGTCSGSAKRTHWRRGHIRNQPTAKGIIRKWIRPCIIGAGKPTMPEVVLT